MFRAPRTCCHSVLTVPYLIKKLDIYLLKNFIVLFLGTFFIAIFILLMQFLWMHVNDLVGKGVAISVLAEFFVYACATVVPLALPLAILLSSLISFGNLSEKFELIAMKAAGISLFRIFRPLAILIAFVSVGALYFSNYILPQSQSKLWALIFSLRQKQPELDIPEGEFYGGIDGLNLYVGRKVDGMLYDVMVYDYSQGFQNATTTRADSARLYFTEDNHYLLFELYNGESFENLRQDQQQSYNQTSIPYRREIFAKKRVLMDFDDELKRFDAGSLGDQHVSKNAFQLIESIDSVQLLADSRGQEQSAQLLTSSYFNRERQPAVVLQAPEPYEKDAYRISDLEAKLTPAQRSELPNLQREKAQNMRDRVDYNCLMMDDYLRYIRKHEIELHRKFTLAFACLVFFFIGAPLGTIIRKGGLGAPVVISVVLFIIYYIIDNTGYKMAREAIVPVWEGMWLSSSVLLPVGIFLSYKAATDSVIFNPEAWFIRWQNMRARARNSHIAKLRQKIREKQWIQLRKR